MGVRTRVRNKNWGFRHAVSLQHTVRKDLESGIHAPHRRRATKPGRSRSAGGPRALRTLIAGVPLTALDRTLTAPPRWRGVFTTSLFTALFSSTALVFTNTDGPLSPIVYLAWAASALQFAHRCVHYREEVEDAARCAEREPRPSGPSTEWNLARKEGARDGARARTRASHAAASTTPK